MKEVTEWDNNPREMWVWNENESEKKLAKVVYFLKNSARPVVAEISKSERDLCVETFLHCAEPEKQRYMTNQELSWWLRDGFHREIRLNIEGYVFSCYDYPTEKEKENCNSEHFVEIRENGGEWRQPLIYE